MKKIFYVLFISTIGASSLLFPSRSQAAGPCHALREGGAEVSVNLLKPDPAFEFVKERAMNKKQEKMAEEWFTANGLQTLWVSNEPSVAGISAGGWAASADIEIERVPYDKHNTHSCGLFRKVNIDLMYRTVFFIPDKYKSGSCEFNLILGHQAKHYAETGKIVDTYVQRMKMDIGLIVADAEGNYVGTPSYKTHEEGMRAAVTDAINLYFTDYMKKDIAATNPLIDTPEDLQKLAADIKSCRKKK